MPHCAILEQKCSTLWENDAKCHIFLNKKNKNLYLKKSIFWAVLKFYAFKKVFFLNNMNCVVGEVAASLAPGLGLSR